MLVMPRGCSLAIILPSELEVDGCDSNGADDACCYPQLGVVSDSLSLWVSWSDSLLFRSPEPPPSPSPFSQQAETVLVHLQYNSALMWPGSQPPQSCFPCLMKWMRRKLRNRHPEPEGKVNETRPLQPNLRQLPVSFWDTCGTLKILLYIPYCLFLKSHLLPQESKIKWKRYPVQIDSLSFEGYTYLMRFRRLYSMSEGNPLLHAYTRSDCCSTLTTYKSHPCSTTERREQCQTVIHSSEKKFDPESSFSVLWNTNDMT